MVIEGEDAISKLRELIKIIRVEVPKMLNEEPKVTENVMHGSDCKESATNEITLFNKLAK
jgi:nucleoside diphosphate kinase